MKFKEILEKKAKEIRETIEKSTDATEVRELGETLKAILDELKALDEAEDKDKDKDKDKEDGKGDEPPVEGERNSVPVGAVLRNSAVLGGFGINENLEYRNAFKEFVLKNTPIPTELRDNANTTTTDVGTVIPTELVNRIVEKMDNVGMILPLITRTSYAAGVTIPKSSVKPVATWVAEGATSDRQKKTTGSVVFTYHKLRCEISMSMEVGTMALSAFEAKFVENVTKAMTYAIENAIINGSGSGQPKGILKETPTTGQALTVKGAKITYADLCDWEAAIPEEYEGTAKWCMSKKTFMSILAITDDNGQPVARVNYGVGGKPERTILGREVVVASKYMPNLAATTANTFAFAFDFADYCLNTIYDMGISKKQDWDTEDLLTKAVMSVDGKVVDTESLVTVSNTLAS